MPPKTMFLFAAALMSCCAYGAETLDSRLIGTWQGSRDKSTKCQFLAWNTHFTQDGRFEIAFFSDEKRTKVVSTERGTWNASGGKNELKVEGVPKTEVYTYTFIDDDTVRYVNTVKDPSADCQADYEFTERRAKKSEACFDSAEYKTSVAVAKTANSERALEISKAVEFLERTKGLKFDQALKYVMSFSTPETVEYDKSLREVGEKIRPMKPQSPEECAALITLQRQYQTIGKQKIRFIVDRIMEQPSAGSPPNPGNADAAR